MNQPVKFLWDGNGNLLRALTELAFWGHHDSVLLNPSAFLAVCGEVVQAGRAVWDEPHDIYGHPSLLVGIAGRTVKLMCDWPAE